MTSSGNEEFRKVDLNYFFEKMKALIDDEWMQGWSEKFEERYLAEYGGVINCITLPVYGEIK